MTTPHPQPVHRALPAHVASAGHALACLLEGDLDLDVRLTLLEALRILTDVHPSYPPITDDIAPIDLDDGLWRTRIALASALAVSTDIGDLIRAARAAQVLAVFPTRPPAAP